jgi:phenylacetate-CoA ligase
MQVLGRRDSVVQVRGLGLHVDDIIEQVEREPGVSRAQIRITEQRGRVSKVDVLMMVGPDAAPDLAERLRKDLISATFTISTAFQHDPESFQVKVVDSLVSNDRTGKTSNFVVREQS